MKARDLVATVFRRSRFVLAAMVASAFALFSLPAAAVAAPPVLTVDSVVDVSYATAKATGTVTFDKEEDGGSDGFWFFEYCLPAAPGECTETGGPWQNGPEAFSHTLPAGSTAVPVEEQLTGLKAGTEYLVRLKALPFAGGEYLSPEPYEAFETLAVAAPTVSNLEFTAVTADSAHFSADVDPNGTDPAFDTSWHFECTPTCPGLEGGTVSGAPDTVEADATELVPNTSYTVKLVATNAGGTAEASGGFQTDASAPLVKAWAAGPVSSDQASINAMVNPRGSDTVYWFEWGTQDCSANPCQSLPAAHDGDAGSGPFNVYVTRQLTGLQPGTTYHFRVVAENATGAVEGPDVEFTTAAPQPACTNAGKPGAGFLPDCRAWEMVSPPDKNGADVIADSSKTFSSSDGGGVSYGVLSAFGDVKGTSVDVQYLGRRTGSAGTNGWSTHAITPPISSQTFESIATENMPTFEAAFTPDLSAAVFRSWNPLTGSVNEKGVSNLYRLDDLDAPASAASLLTGSVSPLAEFDPGLKQFVKTAFAGASHDLDHVIFETPWDLLGEGGFAMPFDLYEHVSGEGVREVGRVPGAGQTWCDDSTGPPCITAPSSQAGITPSWSTQRYSVGMISDDGSRILFQTPGSSPAGAAASGALFLRQDGTTTFQVNASEKTTPDELPGTARAWGMSGDGSRLFFTTSEGLVDGDDAGDSDLYMYEVNEPIGSRLTLLSADETLDAHSAGEVFGISEDGRYVYFASDGQLVSGEPQANFRGMYVWHEGEIDFFGSLNSGGDVSRNTDRTSFAFHVTRKTSRITPDGRYLLFMTHDDEGFRGRGGFSGYNHGSVCTYDGSGQCRELYLYSADSGRLECVSCNPLEDTATGDAITDPRVGAASSVQTQHLSRAISDDGRRVFFSTPEAMVPDDSNGKFDAYMYDVPAGVVSLLSSGTSKYDSYYLESSPDGEDAFFVTRERLVGWDTDDNYDLYDARVGGGFPEPAPVTAPCDADGCLPAIESPPPPGPTSSDAPAETNPAPKCPKGKRPIRAGGRYRCVPTRCPKGTRRVDRDGRSRCVRVKKKRRTGGSTQSARPTYFDRGGAR